MKLFARLVLALALAFALVLGVSDRARAAPASASPASAVPGEAIVEGRLLAPCCYMQTLDVHESEMATELRREVRARLGAGESQETIEDDFALRYGERVRAVPKGKDPRGTMFVASIGALVAAAVTLGVLLRRWRRTASDPPRGGSISADRDVLDDRVDELLHDLDG